MRPIQLHDLDEKYETFQYLRSLESELTRVRNQVFNLSDNPPITSSMLDEIKSRLQAGGSHQLSIENLPGVAAQNQYATFKRVTALPDPYTTNYNAVILAGRADKPDSWWIRRTDVSPYRWQFMGSSGGGTTTGAVLAASSIAFTDVGQQNVTIANGTNNDVEFSASVELVRLTGPTSTWTVTGLKGGASARRVILFNVSGQTGTLAHNSSSSAAGNRFNFDGSANRTLVDGDSLMLVYDSVDQRWRPASMLLNNTVTDADLRDSAALSVIGRAANSIGDPADIVAALDGSFLRRKGTTLGFGTEIQVDADGDIGIGAAPAATFRLWVENASTAAFVGINTSGAPSTFQSGLKLYDNGALKWQLIKEDDNTFNILDGASALALQIDASRNVGIGGAPAARLDVFGPAATQEAARIRIDNTTTGGYLQLYDTAGAVARGFIGFGPAVITSAGISDLAIRSQAALAFSTGGGAERMRITSTGNVGIGGTPTSDVLFYLKKTSADIQSIIETTGTSNRAYIRFVLPASSTNNDVNGIYVQEGSGNYSAGNRFWVFGYNPANDRIELKGGDAGTLRFSVTDAGAATFSGTITERDRSKPIGEGDTWTPTYGSSSGTWTVEAGDQITKRYCLVGKKAFFEIKLNATTLATSASTNLSISMPSGVVAANSCEEACVVYSVDNQVTYVGGGIVRTIAGDSNLYIYRDDFAAQWPTGTNHIFISFRTAVEFQ